jgi:hypothetical protein
VAGQHTRLSTCSKRTHDFKEQCSDPVFTNTALEDGTEGILKPLCKKVGEYGEVGDVVEDDLHVLFCHGRYGGR